MMMSKLVSKQMMMIKLVSKLMSNLIVSLQRQCEWVTISPNNVTISPILADRIIPFVA